MTRIDSFKSASLNDPRPVAVILCGVSACGKSSAGISLAKRLQCEFLEGDDYHSPSNIAKMSSGIPLQDEDRWPWLRDLTAATVAGLERARIVVVACSALQPKYRAYYSQQLETGGISTLFILLEPDRALLEERLDRRVGRHFMAPSLLGTQLALLTYDDSEWYLHFSGDPYPSTEGIVSYIDQKLKDDGLLTALPTPCSPLHCINP